MDSDSAMTNDLKEFWKNIWESIQKQLSHARAPIVIESLRKVIVTQDHNFQHDVKISEYIKEKAPDCQGYKNVFWVAFLTNSNAKINADNYKRIKEYATGQGIYSQCISGEVNPNAVRKSSLWANHLKNKDKMNEQSILPNIWRQIVNKTGVLCWWTDLSEILPKTAGKNVFIVGIDVHHSYLL